MERDVAKLQRTLQDNVEKAMSDLDRDFLRKMQAAYFKCGLKCCETSDTSVGEVQRCIESCEAPLTQAHNLMQSEMSSFQSRVQQCAAECSNRARDGLKDDSTDAQVKAAQQQAFECTRNCIDTQLSTAFPALIDRLRTQLQKLKSSQLTLLS